MPIDDAVEALCQADADDDGVGDACQGDQAAFAAGPVGMGPEDDFDQDGVDNIRDGCPRIPLPDAIPCDGAEDCPENRECARANPDQMGVCNHADLDGDDVGDVCDTCAHTANAEQFDVEQDDDDGDFVGRACEPGPDCEGPENPRAFGFHEVSVLGQCCTVQLMREDDGGLLDLRTGLPLVDPDGLPVREVCTDAQVEGNVCRRLPSPVATLPGVLEPPAGCVDALEGMSPADNRALTVDDFGGDVDALWERQCVLPLLDQDFDGVGDVCDLCPFAFDPRNRRYTDPYGKQWPGQGAYCNGPVYSLDAQCDDEDESGATGTGTGTGGDEEGTGDGTGSGTG